MPSRLRLTPRRSPSSGNAAAPRYDLSVVKRMAAPLAVLTAIAATVGPAGAKEPPQPPSGSWNLAVTHSYYAGPSGPLQRALTRLIRPRVTLRPVCVQAGCPVNVGLVSWAGRAVDATARASAHEPYRTALRVRSSARCGGRPLRVTLAIEIGTDSDLVLDTRAFVESFRACRVFRGWPDAERTALFVGIKAP